MAAKKEDIAEWFNGEKDHGYTHMIIVCDTFDWEDYPVYILPEEDVRKRYKELNGPNMQKVMEVYSYKLSLEEQLKEHRAFNF